MINLQVREAPVRTETGYFLDVVEIFKTIQGEGPFAGFPATFIRLAGCNLQCSGCDTNYTEGRRRMSLDGIQKEVLDTLFPVQPYLRRRLAVITGGEPFRQDIGNLTRRLLQLDFRVQIETNGTFYDEDMPWAGDVYVVCSPKTPQIARGLLSKGTAFKYVIEEGYVDGMGLPSRILGDGPPPYRPYEEDGFEGPIYLTPMDSGCPEQNQKNMKAAAESALKYGWILQSQMHKTFGLR